MRFRCFESPFRFSLLASCLAASVGMGVFAGGSHSLAQDAPGAADSKAPEARSSEKALKKHRSARKVTASKSDAGKNGKGAGEKEAVGKEAEAKDPAAGKKQVPEDTTGSISKPSSQASGAIDFAAQLEKAGASACRNQVNALATTTMSSVEKFNTVSNWSQVAGEKRAVSVAIGQKFRAGSVVPFGVAQVISAPNQQGGCDGFVVQVFPSPLSCGKLRESITAQHGKQIGDLAGVPLMQDAAGRTMLVPTSADTCVLVSTRTAYSK